MCVDYPMSFLLLLVSTHGLPNFGFDLGLSLDLGLRLVILMNSFLAMFFGSFEISVNKQLGFPGV